MADLKKSKTEKKGNELPTIKDFKIIKEIFKIGPSSLSLILPMAMVKILGWKNGTKVEVSLLMDEDLLAGLEIRRK